MQKFQIASFFVFRRNRATFWPLVLREPSTERCSSIFDLGPLTPKIYYPKFTKKIVYYSACMTDRPEMFGPTRGFSGMAESMEPCKMLRADAYCRGNDIWTRRGDLFAYRLVPLFVCHAPSNCFLFFVSRWNRAIFGRQFSMWHSTKRCSKILDLLPWQRNLGYF